MADYIVITYEQKLHIKDLTWLFVLWYGCFALCAAGAGLRDRVGVFRSGGQLRWLFAASSSHFQLDFLSSPVLDHLP